MDISTWLLFIAVGIAAVASPGPAILLALSNSVRFGMAKVLLSTLGNVTGLFILSTSAIFGLGAILKTSNHLFFFVKLIGAAYLIYMGIRQWRSTANFFAGQSNVNQTDYAIENNEQQKLKSNLQIFNEGFLIAITNPKAILFFTALFPQFIDTNQALPQQFLIMTFTFMAMSFICLMGYGFLASRVKKWFVIGNHTNWFNRVLGGIFVAIGVGVLSIKIEH